MKVHHLMLTSLVAASVWAEHIYPWALFVSVNDTFIPLTEKVMNLDTVLSYKTPPDYAVQFSYKDGIVSTTETLNPGIPGFHSDTLCLSLARKKDPLVFDDRMMVKNSPLFSCNLQNVYFIISDSANGYCQPIEVYLLPYDRSKNAPVKGSYIPKVQVIGPAEDKLTSDVSASSDSNNVSPPSFGDKDPESDASDSEKINSEPIPAFESGSEKKEIELEPIPDFESGSEKKEIELEPIPDFEPKSEKKEINSEPIPAFEPKSEKNEIDSEPIPAFEPNSEKKEINSEPAFESGSEKKEIISEPIPDFESGSEKKEINSEPIPAFEPEQKSISVDSDISTTSVYTNSNAESSTSSICSVHGVSKVSEAPKSPESPESSVTNKLDEDPHSQTPGVSTSQMSNVTVSFDSKQDGPESPGLNTDDSKSSGFRSLGVPKSFVTDASDVAAPNSSSKEGASTDDVKLNHSGIPGTLDSSNSEMPGTLNSSSNTSPFSPSISSNFNISGTSGSLDSSSKNLDAANNLSFDCVGCKGHSVSGLDSDKVDQSLKQENTTTTMTTTSTATICTECKAGSTTTVWKTHTNFVTYCPKPTKVAITVCPELCHATTITVTSATTLTIPGVCIVPEIITADDSTPKGPIETAVAGLKGTEHSIAKGESIPKDSAKSPSAKSPNGNVKVEDTAPKSPNENVEFAPKSPNENVEFAPKNPNENGEFAPKSPNENVDSVPKSPNVIDKMGHSAPKPNRPSKTSKSGSVLPKKTTTRIKPPQASYFDNAGRTNSIGAGVLGFAALLLL